MNPVVLQLPPCLFRAKQNEINGLKETSCCKHRNRPNHMSSGCSKDLNIHNVSYFMEFSSCSEKRYSLMCLETCYSLRFFK